MINRYYYIGILLTWLSSTCISQTSVGCKFESMDLIHYLKPTSMEAIDSMRRLRDKNSNETKYKGAYFKVDSSTEGTLRISRFAIDSQRVQVIVEGQTVFDSEILPHIEGVGTNIFSYKREKKMVGVLIVLPGVRRYIYLNVNLKYSSILVSPTIGFEDKNANNDTLPLFLDHVTERVEVRYYDVLLNSFNE